MTTEDHIRSVALSLPETLERASYGGQPSWRTRQRMFAWIRDDPEALVVWVESEEDKLALIDAEPDKFFTADHYDGSPMVLVNIEAVDDSEAAELITESWILRGPRKLVATWVAEAGGGPVA